MRILCLDIGSSSLKLAVYEKARTGDTFERLVAADAPLPADGFRAGAGVERILQAVPDGNVKTGRHGPPVHPLAGIGHRVVFGGPQRVAAVLADDRVLDELEAYVPMEPLHLRAQLDLIGAIRSARPGLPQVLCFDTAFHHDMPHVAQLVALPPDAVPGIRRYGFHGLSYEYIVSKLDGAPGRTRVAHLGSGASLCAIRDGAPVDTTMGFSPLSGLVMATRPGDLDPGAILALVRDGRSVAEITDLLYRGSGLLGVSGVSPDLRALIAASPDNPRARDAVALFQYELIKHMGAMIAALGGLDTLVFTGGIGEHQPSVRSAACEAFRFLGVHVDEAANARNADSIALPESRAAIRVIPTDENLMVARHAAALL